MNSGILPVPSPELDAALAAVRDAMRVCRSVQASFDGGSLAKEDKSPVTIADFGSQAVVCRRLAETFPHDPIIGEEDSSALMNEEHAPFLHRIHDEVCRNCIEATPDQICHWIDRGNASEYSDRFWTLDPIDGTKGFLRQGQYAVSLALIVNGRIELGVLGCPNLAPSGIETDSVGTLYFAVRGQGAFGLSLAEGATAERIHVSRTTDSTRARFCESVESGHSNQGKSAAIGQKLGITANPARLDSQAKYAVVARGEADLYLRLPTKADYREMIWDHAGGVIVVEEAGGRVTDVDGKPLDFTLGKKLLNNRGVVASNRALHDVALKTLAEVGV